MIRFFRAMAWLRWRTMINSMRGGRRRDGLERFSRIGARLVPIFYALMLVPTILALSLGGFVGGWYMGSHGVSSGPVLGIARVLLALATGAVLLAPLVRSVQGLQNDITRLLLLPVSRRLLHLGEFAGGLADPWLFVMIPPLVLLPVGLMAGGAPVAGVLALLAGLLLVAALSSLSSLCTFGTMLIFRDRRRAEGLTLVLLVALGLVGFLPLFLDDEWDPASTIDSASSVDSDGKRELDEESDRGLTINVDKAFRWAAPLPSETYARSLAAAADGRQGDAVAQVAALALTVGLLYFFSGLAYGRLVETPEASGRKRAQGPARIWAPTIPGGSEVVAAVAFSLVRTTLRTVRGKLAVYYIVVVVILVYVTFGRKLVSKIPEDLPLDLGPMLLLFGAVITFLSLQPILLNVFAIDGAGLTLQFLAPTSDRDLVKGKIIGCSVLASISLSLCLIAAAIVSPSGSPLAWLSVVLVCLSSFALLAPISALLSVLFPKAADLNRIGKAGNPHPFAGFLGMLATGLALTPPIALFAGGLFVWSNGWITLASLAAWSLAVGLVALPLINLCASMLGQRRENLVFVAGGR